MKRLFTPLLFSAFATIFCCEVIAQATSSRLVIRAQRQEVNVRSGIITVSGNVKMDYPARQIQATSSEAQYFTKEKKIILRGDVVVNQLGNNIKADTITYLIDEGKFDATPKQNQQVESIYIIDDPDAVANPIAATTPVQKIKPTFKQFVSPTEPTIEIRKQ